MPIAPGPVNGLNGSMTCHPVVVVHSLAEVRRAAATARAQHRGVTLLSAPGAALAGGCLWWQQLVAIARAEFPDVPIIDILDCADDTTQAWAAARIGLTCLVLAPGAPGRGQLRAAVAAIGGTVLCQRPELA